MSPDPSSQTNCTGLVQAKVRAVEVGHFLPVRFVQPTLRHPRSTEPLATVVLPTEMPAYIPLTQGAQQPERLD